MDDLRDAIEMVRIGGPYRSYPGTGGVWAGRNENAPDANFVDWGLARATTTILNAVIDGKLKLADNGPTTTGK